ncbi:winged helix-turn-helix domain-containing protein [Pseudoalteromonas piscicida]|uniref:winged helix-turn-helix domain-containing protein n=1 Tax=Pseudoalteromonas piscicida TaxID=43662 RepID=UPI000E35AF83|nr:winged helix-turn-helix domain-containing protein [Pseudoalteromonas piscicida]AXQ99517.1 hypothetical protein D0N37_18545 [Pseudoalteromonas piscicida]
MEIKCGNWDVFVDDLVVQLHDEMFKLEPKTMDLLVCLIKNQGAIMSKDALIESVWDGMIVSDHAVTSCIAKLRKVLSQDQSIPVYIETISKRGYRIPKQVYVSVSKQEVAEDVSHVPVANNMKLVKILAVLILVLIVVLIVFYSADTLSTVKESHVAEKPLKFQGMHPITSLEGPEKTPRASPDGKFISYLSFNLDEKRWDINISLSSSREIVYSILGVSEFTAPAWSFSSDRIVFHRVGEDYCEIYIAALHEGTWSEKSVYTCELFSHAMDFAWDKKPELIYFNEKPYLTEPAAVFQLNLNTGRKVQVTNPIVSGFGDYRLNYSYDLGLLYFLRNEHWKKSTDFYSLDPLKREIKHLFKKDRLIKYFTLTEAGYPLFSSSKYSFDYFDLLTMKQHSAYRASFPVKHPQIFAGDEKLLFMVESIKGRDLEIFSHNKDVPSSLLKALNTSRDDYSPRFANNTGLLAFISNRNGSPQVFIVDMQGKLISKSKLIEGVHPTDLVWSADDSKVLFLFEQDIYSIDVNTGEHKVTKLYQPYYAFSDVTQDGHSYYLSSDHRLDWQIYKIYGGKVEQVTDKGGYYGIESDDGKYLYFSKFRTKGLWRKDIEADKEELVIPDIDLLNTGGFQILGKYIYYKENTKDGFIVFQFDTENDGLMQFANIKGEIDKGFSVSFDGKYIIYTNNMTEVESDIVMAERLR